MLHFMRKHTAWIGWGIIGFFVITTFAGALFFREAQQTETIAPQQEVDFAAIGPTPINYRKYQEGLSSRLNRYAESASPFEPLSPEQYQSLQFEAFTRALHFSLLLKGAQENKVKVAKADLRGALNSTYEQFDVKGKKELKALLEENQYPFDLFLSHIKEDILAQKFVDHMVEQIRVSDQDVTNQYTELRAQHILIRPQTPTQNRSAEDLAKDKINDVLDEIKGGMSFADAAKKHSQDYSTAPSGGELGWFKSGQMVPEFEQVAFSLEIGELSQPVQTPYGFHLIRVQDKRDLARPENFDLEKERETIRYRRQNQAVQTYLADAIGSQSLDIAEPSLKAYYAQSRRDYSTAVGAYQTMISQNPESPVPHYFLAQLYFDMNEDKKAVQELKRAEIKSELRPEFSLPYVHIELGNYYWNNKQKKQGRAQYDKAIDAGKNNLTVLNTLSKIFETNKDKKRKNKVLAEQNRLKRELEKQANDQTEDADDPLD